MTRILVSKSNAIIPFISSFYILRSSSVRPYSSLKGKVGVRINVENEVKCLDDAVNLFNRMVRMKPLPSLPVFCELLNTMINMKHYYAVISLFREMRKLDIPINEFIFSNVINNYCLMHRVDCAFSLLPIHLKSGIPFNVVTFATLIRGLFAEHNLNDAVELFKKVVRENICEPDEIMYGTVVNGLSKRR